jgi:steroid 5-alpha reductase family enzyme
MPVLALNSIPHTALAALPLLGVTDVIGLALFVGGLSFEVAADRQKSAWVQAKKNKEHDEDFLTHGLWSKSRHPNYFVS